MPRKSKTDFGKLGEVYAERLLQHKGYRVIERNYRTKLGEIDIIAEESGTLVFVEVKARWSHKFGRPEEAVDDKKLVKIRRVAEYYAYKHPNAPKKMRIDVVALEVVGNSVISAKLIKGS